MKIKKQKNNLVINIKNNMLLFCVGYFDYTNVYVNKLFKVKLDFNVYEDGLLKDELSLGKLINDSLKKHDIKIKNCYIYVLSPDSIRKKICVPYIENEVDFNDLIYTELSQMLPVELDKYIVKHKLIDEHNKIDTSDVSLNCVLMDKQIINNYKKVLKYAKLKPVVLDLNSSAIENLIKFLIMSNSNSASLINKEIENTISSFIEINSDYCSISIFKNGIIDFSRIIRISDVDKDLYYSSNFIDCIYFENSYEQNDIYEFSNKLLSEINMFLQYYSNISNENEINEIFLYGDHYNVHGINNCAEKIFNIPVNNINMIKGINFKDSIKNSDIAEYINVIGGLIRW